MALVHVRPQMIIINYYYYYYNYYYYYYYYYHHHHYEIVVPAEGGLGVLDDLGAREDAKDDY